MPISIKNSAHQDARYKIMRIIDANPEFSQRQIAQALGVSLGAVNYCLKAMIFVGFVKVKNFRSSHNKLRYAYILTPKGVAEKAALTGAFLNRKIHEFEVLKAEIEALHHENKSDQPIFPINGKQQN
jgi:EPS-associated MarR family transcriptional regulator